MPRISPDGQLIAYTTGSEVRVIASRAPTPSQDEDWAVIGIDEDECTYPDQSVGLAEFVAGEEMDRYEGFWWSPDSRALLVQSTDEEPEPLWYIRRPPPTRPMPAAARRYARALTRNAIVSLAYVDFTVLPAAETRPTPVPSDEEAPLAFSDFTEPRVQVCNVADIDWDHETYEYLAAVNWSKGHEPLLLVQDRLQHHDQVLEVQLKAAGFHAGVDTEAAIGEPVATRVLEEHENPQWLDLIHGTPGVHAGRPSDLRGQRHGARHESAQRGRRTVHPGSAGRCGRSWTSPIPTCSPSSPAPRRPPAMPGSAHGMMTRICTMPAAATW